MILLLRKQILYIAKKERFDSKKCTVVCATDYTLSIILINYTMNIPKNTYITRQHIHPKTNDTYIITKKAHNIEIDIQ